MSGRNAKILRKVAAVDSAKGLGMTARLYRRWWSALPHYVKPHFRKAFEAYISKNKESLKNV